MTLTLQKALTTPQPSRASQLRVYTISAPSAGVDFQFNPNANEIWRVLTLYAQLTTSATVSTRTVNLLMQAGGTNIWIAPQSLQMTASLTYTFAWGYEVAPVSAGIRSSASVPDVLADFTYTIRSFTDNLQAGDQWTPVSVSVFAYV